MERQKIARSAKWGAACAPCVAAKTRCVRSKSPGTKCDRCQSLKKHCSDQVHRPRKKRQVKPSKTTQLEKRIDDLLGALHAFEHGASPTIAGSSPEGNQAHLARNYASSWVSPGLEVQVSRNNEEKAGNIPIATPHSNVSAFTACTCRVPVGKEDLVPLESDETLMSIFINHLSPRFPFVVLPAGTTASQLQETRPLLLQVIRMVASVRNLRSMRGQYRAIIQHISDAMIMRSERSLDLLQSILVVLGFYHYHCMTHAQFNKLTHLAVSLIGDMELNTPPNPQHTINQQPLRHVVDASSRSNEEKRALIGVWYMSSNTALVVRQFEPVRYTKYLNQCLRELEHAAEYETDKLAVQLARIQHVTENIFHFHSQDQMEDGLGTPKLSMSFRIEEFQMELDRLWNELPPNLRSDLKDVLSSHYNSAYLRIFDPLLAGANLPDYEPQSFASLSLSLAGLTTFDIFSRFTARLKAYFDEWLSIPVCSYFYMPQPVSAQLIHAAMMLSRWVRVAGPNAVMSSCSGTAAAPKEVGFLRQPVMAFSGIPECPDLGLQTPLSSASTPAVSAQTLKRLRAQVLVYPALRIDIFKILDAMVIRFNAAEREMVAAHGGAWKNNTWNIAAEHIEMKKTRVQQWCETVAVVEQGINPPAEIFSVTEEGNKEYMDMIERYSIESLEWFASKSNQENGCWENVLFDELMKDIHTADSIDISNGWGLDMLDDMEPMSGPRMDRDV